MSKSAPRLASGLKDPLLLGEVAPPLFGVVAPALLKDCIPEPVDMVRLGDEKSPWGKAKHG